MISDAMDDCFDGDSDMEDEIVQNVMDEIGLQMNCESISMLCCDESSNYNNNNYAADTIGLTFGGAKDVNNFRECIEQKIMPSKSSITYEGLLYQYFFDITNKSRNIPQHLLFYPTYCYARTLSKSFLSSTCNTTANEYEYFLTVGLNSNLKKSEFKRKKLNLICVLDRSGSMAHNFSGESNESKSKMNVANEAVNIIISHLTKDDRFALITFETNAKVEYGLQFIADYNLEEIKNNILQIIPDGSTNFEAGFNHAIAEYQKIMQTEEIDEYENRIIFLTDAQPNVGNTSESSLLELVSKYSEQPVGNLNCNRIYTTFIGIGLDFNASLIQTISQTRGCNYYSVKSTAEFMETMNEDFSFMVTPIVFNVVLRIMSEGNSCQIAKVYGCQNEKKKESMLESGEVTRIHTLFPSRKSKNSKKGTKGGIILVQLTKKESDANEENKESEMSTISVEVSYEDRNGNKFKNEQQIEFDIEGNGNDENMEYFDNLGIRKAIVLCKYVDIIYDWIDNASPANIERNQRSLAVSGVYKSIFSEFVLYFKNEMKICDDLEMQKEIALLQTLIAVENENCVDVKASYAPPNYLTLQQRLDALKR